MSDAYTVYWPQDRWRSALRVHRPLEVMFGGPHVSEPSFRHAKVSVGDLLYAVGVYRQVLLVLGRMRVREIVEVDVDSLDGYFERFASWRFLAPTCTTEVVLGEGGTLVHGNQAVAGEALKTLTYLPRRGPRPIKHVNEDGLLTKAISVQGIYRLAPISALELDAVLQSPPSARSTVPSRPASKQAHDSATSGIQTLF
ncbi:hypothetical protein BJY16_007250 [Actinoplanes octamycinicus]|uniref:Uncharacterized protein n=1 Tax=Actinoplanes octamycinicus TaxID=135948 RepID=A0A7W7MBA5_9ACTN|nr:hypothetical protein [Actinoplanes octamycinicus]MBB4743791.1 hypothetical protein [Actinoplanes octamycinicus]GIE58417.1 hypothetical protein Aoc01nite_38190 [Actinoplanes octamycinicus]